MTCATQLAAIRGCNRVDIVESPMVVCTTDASSMPHVGWLGPFRSPHLIFNQH